MRTFIYLLLSVVNIPFMRNKPFKTHTQLMIQKLGNIEKLLSCRVKYLLTLAIKNQQKKSVQLNHHALTWLLLNISEIFFLLLLKYKRFNLV